MPTHGFSLRQPGNPLPFGTGFSLRKPTFSLPARTGFSLRKPTFSLSIGTGHPLERHSPTKATFSVRSAKGKRALHAAFKEVNEDEPEIVGHTRKKFGAARAKAQKTAIALSKARKKGARIPKG